MRPLTVSGAASAAVKVASARLPSPKTMVGSPAQILAQFPKQQSPKHLQQSSPVGTGVSQSSSSPGSAKPTIQIKQESGEVTPDITCLSINRYIIDMTDYLFELNYV